MAKRIVTVKFSVIEATALLQLAGEASLETFESCGLDEEECDRMIDAGRRAMDKLVNALP